MQTTFTEKEFLNQLSLFREEVGKKDFWVLPKEKREKFQSGIKFAWINTVRDDGKEATPEDYERWAMWIHGALDEYSRREFFMLTRGLK